MEFIGREKELAKLEAVRRSRYRTCAVTGRRRIGKTSLIARFCEGKRSLRIPFVTGSERQNLERICQCISGFEGTEFSTDSLEKAMAEILRLCGTETVLVFDEYPYMAKASERFPGMLQHLVDDIVSGTQSMVVVCGSSLSTMEGALNQYESPLYGRFPNRIALRGLSFEECRGFHPGMSDLDLLKLYMTVGGVPEYHAIMDRPTYWENVASHFLGAGADMAGEGEAIVSREARTGAGHVAVARAVASGSTSLSRIADSAQLDKALCSRYLDDLVGIEVVSRVRSMAGAGKRPAYAVEDPMVDFCLSVAEPASALSSPGPEDGPLGRAVSTFLGKRFEVFCGAFVAEKYQCWEAGRWWGTVVERGERTTADIDVVATVQIGGRKADLFGECRFRKRRTGLETLETLKARASVAKTDRDRRLALFSASGFDEDVEDRAEAEGVLLFGLDELVGRKEPPRLRRGRSGWLSPAPRGPPQTFKLYHKMGWLGPVAQPG